MSTMTTTKTGKGTTLLLIAALVALLTVPLLLNAGSEFGGSDNAGGEVIQELNPGFERWASPVWEPPGPEIQSMLFSLQAALGAGVIGYFFGFKRGQRSGVDRNDGSGARTDRDTNRASR